MTLTVRVGLVAGLGCVLLAGCRVSQHKDGDKNNVDIATPFGSMKVDTNTNPTDTSAIGLTLYPGAVVVKDDDGKNGGSADVNMSFGAFHLGVKAASFQTPDAEDKVLKFYRKDLAKYGDVIECRGNSPVGQPARTSQGLTCDTKQQNHINTHETSDSDLELRAGSEQHQHIVGVEAKNGGTKIGLVMLDLPSHLSNHDGKEVE
jgi:hypothetical protein